MQPALTSLFQFVRLFAQLASIPRDRFELEIRVDYVEPLANSTLKWTSFALLPNNSVISMKTLEFRCNVEDCALNSVLIAEQYGSPIGVMLAKSAGGFASVGPYPPAEANFTRGFFHSIEFDMNILVTNTQFDSTHPNATVLLPIQGPSLLEDSRLFARNFSDNADYGFDRCLVGRVQRRDQSLYVDHLFDIRDSTAAKLSPKQPLEFCFRDYRGNPQTQFFPPELLKLRRPEAKKTLDTLRGIVTVQMTRVPRRLQWFWRVYRHALDGDLFQTRLLTALIAVLGVLLTVVDAIVLLLLCNLNPNSKLKVRPSRSRTQNVTMDTMGFREPSNWKITIVEESTRPEESQLQPSLNSSNRRQLRSSPRRRRTKTVNSPKHPRLVTASSGSREPLKGKPSKEVDPTQGLSKE